MAAYGTGILLPTPSGHAERLVARIAEGMNAATPEQLQRQAPAHCPSCSTLDQSRSTCRWFQPRVLHAWAAYPVGGALEFRCAPRVGAEDAHRQCRSILWRGHPPPPNFTAFRVVVTRTMDHGGIAVERATLVETNGACKIDLFDVSASTHALVHTYHAFRQFIEGAAAPPPLLPALANPTPVRPHVLSAFSADVVDSVEMDSVETSPIRVPTRVGFKSSVFS